MSHNKDKMIHEAFIKTNIFKNLMEKQTQKINCGFQHHNNIMLLYTTNRNSCPYPDLCFVLFFYLILYIKKRVSHKGPAVTVSGPAFKLTTFQPTTFLS